MVRMLIVAHGAHETRRSWVGLTEHNSEIISLEWCRKVSLATSGTNLGLKVCHCVTLGYVSRSKWSVELQDSEKRLRGNGLLSRNGPICTQFRRSVPIFGKSMEK